MMKMNYEKYKVNEEKRNKRKSYIVKRKYSKLRYILQFVVTLLLWLIAFYCFRDVAINTYSYFVETDEQGYIPIDIVRNLAMYGICVFIIIFIWVVYNKLMFGGRDRRKQAMPWSKEQVKTLYEIDDDKYNFFQDNKILSVDFDERNKIKSVTNIILEKQKTDKSHTK